MLMLECSLWPIKTLYKVFFSVVSSNSNLKETIASHLYKKLTLDFLGGIPPILLREVIESSF